MSATNRGGKRLVSDAYETPAWCVERLVEHAWLPRGRYLEPCAGNGAIVRAASANSERGWIQSWEMFEIREECAPHLKAIFNELDGSGHAYRAGPLIGDFLEAAPLIPDDSFDVVITNPPYSLAMEFVEASLRLAPYVAMLLRLNWLGSEGRSRFLRGCMPDVYVLPQRPSFVGGGTDATEYGWFVWTPERDRSVGRIELLALTADEIRRPR